MQFSELRLFVAHFIKVHNFVFVMNLRGRTENAKWSYYIVCFQCVCYQWKLVIRTRSHVWLHNVCVQLMKNRQQQRKGYEHVAFFCVSDNTILMRIEMFDCIIAIINGSGHLAFDINQDTVRNNETTTESIAYGLLVWIFLW